MPGSPEERTKYLQFVYQVVNDHNVHKHTFSCRKSLVGRFRCRFCMPAKTWNMPTQFVRLDPDVPADGVPRVYHTLFPDGPVESDYDNRHAPFPPRFAGVVTLELCRPSPGSSEDHRTRELEAYKARNHAAATSAPPEGAPRYFADDGAPGPNSRFVVHCPALSAGGAANSCPHYIAGETNGRVQSLYNFKYIRCFLVCVCVSSTPPQHCRVIVL